MRLRRAIAVVVCLFTALVGYRIIDVSSIIVLVKQVSVWPSVIYATLSILVSYFFKSLRFCVYISRHSRVSASEFFALYSVSNVIFALAAFTPGQLGDLLKLEYTKRRFGINRLELLVIFIQEKILDLCTLVALFLFGVWWSDADVVGLLFPFIFELEGLSVLFAAGVVLTVIAGVAVLWRYRPHVRKFFSGVDLAALPAALPLTLAFWAAVIWGWHAVWEAHSLGFSYLDTAFAIAGSTIVSIASMIPGAVGVSEISTAASLMVLGGGANDATMASILTRFYMLCIVLNSLVFLFLSLNPLIELYRSPAVSEPLYGENEK